MCTSRADLSCGFRQEVFSICLQGFRACRTKKVEVSPCVHFRYKFFCGHARAYLFLSVQTVLQRTRNRLLQTNWAPFKDFYTRSCSSLQRLLCLCSRGKTARKYLTRRRALLFAVTYCSNRRHAIEKDVMRTDRTRSFYAEDDGWGLLRLDDILTTYCMYNFDLGEFSVSFVEPSVF